MCSWTSTTVTHQQEEFLFKTKINSNANSCLQYRPTLQCFKVNVPKEALEVLFNFDNVWLLRVLQWSKNIRPFPPLVVTRREPGHWELAPHVRCSVTVHEDDEVTTISFRTVHMSCIPMRRTRVDITSNLSGSGMSKSSARQQNNAPQGLHCPIPLPHDSRQQVQLSFLLKLIAIQDQVALVDEQQP